MTIDYRLEGAHDAPLLVLSNSLGTTWDLWQPQIATLITHFRVLRYNPRGHGHSPLPGQVLTLARLGQDVVDLLDELGVEQASFCGISMGGLTGLWLARYHPQRFRRMVVANTAARIGSAEGWQQRAHQVLDEGLGQVAAGAAARWFTPDFLAAAPPQAGRLIRQLANSNVAGYAACCGALATADLRKQVRRILLPLLVIAGEQDPVTTVEDARWLQSQIAGAELAVLPASHLSNVACPQAFSNAVCQFLTR